LIRVCAPDDIILAYEDASEIDRLARAKAIKWDIENRDLLVNPPRIRFYAPQSSRFDPTRISVISVDITRKNVSDSGFFNLQYVLSPETFLHNIQVLNSVRPLLGKATTLDKFLFYDIENADLLDMLNRLEVLEADRSELETFKEIVSYSSFEGGFEATGKKLVIDLDFADRIVDVDYVRSISDAEFESWPMSRSVNFISPISLEKWRNLQNLENFKLASIKAVVGAGERKVQELCPDDVLIHCRVYKLYSDSNHSPGARASLGLSVIGWIPTTSDRLWIHEQV
jgi:hypothetical protein